MRRHIILLTITISLLFPKWLSAMRCETNIDGNNSTWSNWSNLAYTESSYIVYDFETEESLEGWVAIDNDDDGHNWQVADLGDAGHAMISQSYNNETYSPLTPDNWLISPAITAGSQVKFDAWGRDPNYASEVFKVYVGPATYTNLDDFTALTEDITTVSDVTTYEFDLSAYEYDICIAIRHYNVTDMFILCVDNFTVIAKDTPEAITTTVTDGKIDDSWYNLQGVKFTGKPSIPGIYIHNGKKVVIK